MRLDKREDNYIEQDKNAISSDKQCIKRRLIRKLFRIEYANDHRHDQSENIADAESVKIDPVERPDRQLQ